MDKVDKTGQYNVADEERATSRYFFSPIENTYEWMFGIGHDIDTPIQMDEIRALIRYAAENGIDPAGPDPTRPTETTLALLKNALQDLEICRAQSYEDEASYLQAVKEIESKILLLYARLTRATNEGEYNINGRTLVDTKNSGRAMLMLVLFTMFLVGLALAEDMLTGIGTDEVFPTDGSEWWFRFFTNNFFQHISPFIWGALGGCIYLTMRLYSFASHRAFDRSRYHGWFLRVVLASIIGAVTIHIVDPAALTESGIPIATKTLAFLSGLSVKVVYGGFQKLILTLVEKFNLDSLQTAKPDKDMLRKFITAKLGDPEFSDDQIKKETLTALLMSLEKKNST